MATLEKIDGFEHGRVAVDPSGPYNATASVPTIVTTPVRTGLRSLEITAPGAAEHVTYNIAAGNRIITQAVYIRFAALPTGAGVNDDLVVFGNAGGNGVLAYNVDNNQFRVTNGSSSALGGPTLAINTWYRVVIEYDTSGANAIMRATVDGGTEFSVSTARAAADTTTVRLGTLSANTYTAYFDDWLISITDADYEEIEGWTSHRAESLIVNADGSHNITTSGDFDSFVGTAFSNATTTGNTFIDHRPLQMANTADAVIRQELGTTANYMEFTNENLSANTDPVDGVRTYASHVESASAGASLGEAQLLLSDNTEVLTTGSISAINSTEDPSNTVKLRHRMTIAPSGGWDGTKVDGLKWRIGFGDAAPDVNFVDLMVEVAQHVVAVVVNPTRPTIILNAVHRSFSW